MEASFIALSGHFEKFIGHWLFQNPCTLLRGPCNHPLLDWAQPLAVSDGFLRLGGHAFQWIPIEYLGVLSSDPPVASLCFLLHKFWCHAVLEAMVVHPHLFGIFKFRDTMSSRFVVNFVLDFSFYLWVASSYLMWFFKEIKNYTVTNYLFRMLMFLLKIKFYLLNKATAKEKKDLFLYLQKYSFELVF